MHTQSLRRARKNPPHPTPAPIYEDDVHSAPHLVPCKWIPAPRHTMLPTQPQAAGVKPLPSIPLPRQLATASSSTAHTAQQGRPRLGHLKPTAREPRACARIAHVTTACQRPSRWVSEHHHVVSFVLCFSGIHAFPPFPELTTAANTRARSLQRALGNT